jgi:hypothetical protein
VAGCLRILIELLRQVFFSALRAVPYKSAVASLSSDAIFLSLTSLYMQLRNVVMVQG